MPFSDQYRRQVSLLVRSLPFIAEEDCFALKGGTAINLFVRDLPRLSVDIDLTYLPIHDRNESLAEINAAMERIADRITRGLPNCQTQLRRTGEFCDKVFVKSQNTRIKIEVTPVMRGCVYQPESRSVTPRVEDDFGFAEVRIVSFADLYAGKIVAALDRQHPRDFFDIRTLLANEGIDNKLRDAFIVYLVSHNRTIAEVLAPTRLDIAREFERGFVGMTEEPVGLGELVDIREQLITTILGDMSKAHKEFLISFKAGETDWNLLDVPHAKDLPAIKWKQHNLNKLAPGKRDDLLNRLKDVLDVA